MEKNELLSLLGDADVQEKILSIVNQQTNGTQEKIPEAIDNKEQSQLGAVGKVK